MLKNPELETIRQQYQNDCFSMFTSAGARKIRNYFMTLLKRLDADCSRAAALRAFTCYFKAYRRAKTSKNHTECGDTAVRESVWCAALSVDPERRYEISIETLDALWDKYAY